MFVKKCSWTTKVKICDSKFFFRQTAVCFVNTYFEHTTEIEIRSNKQIIRGPDFTKSCIWFVAGKEQSKKFKNKDKNINNAQVGYDTSLNFADYFRKSIKTNVNFCKHAFATRKIKKTNIWRIISKTFFYIF